MTRINLLVLTLLCSDTIHWKQGVKLTQVPLNNLYNKPPTPSSKNMYYIVNQEKKVVKDISNKIRIYEKNEYLESFFNLFNGITIPNNEAFEGSCMDVEALRTFQVRYSLIECLEFTIFYCFFCGFIPFQNT